MNSQIVDAPTRWLRTAEFAVAWLGSDSPAAKIRVRRACDEGSLACVRLGKRGDRLIPSSELDRLQSEAAANLRPRGGGDAAA